MGMESPTCERPATGPTNADKRRGGILKSFFATRRREPMTFHCWRRASVRILDWHVRE